MYAEIRQQADKHSISELCAVYGVSRSGYYKWLGRAGALNGYERGYGGKYCVNADWGQAKTRGKSRGIAQQIRGGIGRIGPCL